mgnify:CR=1 FL=1
MAYKKKSAEASAEKTYFNIDGMTVTNCRVLSDNVLAFTLTGKGIGLYNLRVVDSKNGKFVGAPQSKGKDGNWYNQYALYLTDEDQKKIIEEVEKQLEL